MFPVVGVHQVWFLFHKKLIAPEYIKKQRPLQELDLGLAAWPLKEFTPVQPRVETNSGPFKADQSEPHHNLFIVFIFVTQ